MGSLNIMDAKENVRKRSKQLKVCNTYYQLLYPLGSVHGFLRGTETG